MGQPSHAREARTIAVPPGAAPTGGRRVLLAIPLTFEMVGSPLVRMGLAPICRRPLAEHRQYLLFMLTDVSRLTNGACSARLGSFLYDIISPGRP